MRGVSDEEIESGRYTIFLTRDTKSRVLRDARWVDERSKVSNIQDTIGVYDSLLRSYPAMSASNADVMSSVIAALSNT